MRLQSVERLPEDLGLTPAPHKLMPLSSVLRREKDQKFKVVLRLQRKFKNTEDFVHPQPIPLKREKGSLLRPTLNRVRHIYLVS